METVLSALNKGVDFLKEKGVESPRLDSELLLRHVLSCSQVDLYLNFNQPLSDNELDTLRQLFVKKGERVPVQYLINKKEFMEHEFFVDERVLVPRPETEILVEQCILLAKGMMGSIRLLDLCTGSGCIAISLALALPECYIIATDKSEHALSVATQNARCLHADIRFVAGDLFEPLAPAADVVLDANVEISSDRPDRLDAGGGFDIIVSNPPYLSQGDMEGLMPEVKDHEPCMALLSGDTGLECIERILTGAPDFLKPGGMLLMEIGCGQSGGVRSMVEGITGSDGEPVYKDLTFIKDYSGIERVALLRMTDS